MLVLSRSQNQRVLFPNLGVSVEVLQIRGNRVSIGIDAPPEVHILRGELPHAEEQAAKIEQQPMPRGRLSHRFRNQLNAANLAVQLAQKQLEAGYTIDAQSSLEIAVTSFQKLETEAGSAKESVKQKSIERSRRALIVEDNGNECELLAGYLRLSGFEVETAGDGFQALSRLSKDHDWDCVLLDMHMPRMDGPRTITSIRCNPDYQGVKLFAVSGSERSEVGVTTGPRGVDRWFAKPINPQQLVAEITRELDTVCTSA